MKKIKMIHGFEALVDDEDYNKVIKYTWYKDNRGYVVNSLKRFQLHSFIMNTPKGMDTDHINHNPLDNRKSNLRICTRSQNLRNALKGNRGKTSKYKGVSRWNNIKWQSYIYLNGKNKFLGLYNTEKEAAEVYKKAALENFKEFAIC